MQLPQAPSPKWQRSQRRRRTKLPDPVVSLKTLPIAAGFFVFSPSHYRIRSIHCPNTMSRLTDSHAWQALVSHRAQLAHVHMRELFRTDAGRAARFHVEAAGLKLDYSKNPVTAQTLQLLTALARQEDVSTWVERMFRGERVNNTEARAAFHVALRGDGPMLIDGSDVMPSVARVKAAMRRFSDAVRNGTHCGHTGKPLRSIVNIGIGGSDLGPLMACEALAPYRHPRLTSYFVSNVDGTHLAEVLKRVDAEA